MRKLAEIAVSVFLMLSLCACAEYITEGTIYEKEFEPAHTVRWTQFILSGKVLVPIAQSADVPDSWYFSICQGDGDERKTARWEVSESQYNSYEVGDYFVATEEETDK